jgi:hypothetical protein
MKLNGMIERHGQHGRPNVGILGVMIGVIEHKED